MECACFFGIINFYVKQTICIMQDQDPSLLTRLDFFLHINKKQQKFMRTSPLSQFALRKMQAVSNFLDPRGLANHYATDEPAEKQKNNDSSS